MNAITIFFGVKAEEGFTGKFTEKIMTVLNRNQIPLSVNTVEKLYAWAGTLLDAMNPTLRTLEDENVSEKATQLVVKPSILAGPLFIARITLPLNSNHASSTDPFWLNVTELSNTAIPAAWTTGS